MAVFPPFPVSALLSARTARRRGVGGADIGRGWIGTVSALSFSGVAEAPPAAMNGREN